MRVDYLNRGLSQNNFYLLVKNLHSFGIDINFNYFKTKQTTPVNKSIQLKL